MDMIMATLMSQLADEVPDVIVPKGPENPDKVTLVQDVLTPIIIQFINNDVMPAIPTCTFPKGRTGEDYGLAEGSWIQGEGASDDGGFKGEIPDPMELAREVMKLAMEDTKVPDGVDIDALIDDALKKNADAILVDDKFTDKETMKTLSVMISGLKSSVGSWYTDNSVEQE